MRIGRCGVGQVARLLIAPAIALVLAACGGGSSKSSTGDTGATTHATPTIATPGASAGMARIALIRERLRKAGYSVRPDTVTGAVVGSLKATKGGFEFDAVVYQDAASASGEARGFAKLKREKPAQIAYALRGTTLYAASSGTLLPKGAFDKALAVAEGK